MALAAGYYEVAHADVQRIACLTRLPVVGADRVGPSRTVLRLFGFGPSDLADLCEVVGSVVSVVIRFEV